MGINKSSNDNRIENLLSDHAAAIIDGTANIDLLLEKYGLPKDTPEAMLMVLAERIYDALPHVEPSPEFVKSLYHDLVGSAEINLREWIRQLQFDNIKLDNLKLENLRLDGINLNHTLERLRQMQLVQLDRLPNLRQIPRRTQIQLAAGLTLAGVVYVASRVRREGGGLLSSFLPTPIGTPSATIDQIDKTATA